MANFNFSKTYIFGLITKWDNRDDLETFCEMLKDYLYGRHGLDNGKVACLSDTIIT